MKPNNKKQVQNKLAKPQRRVIKKRKYSISITISEDTQKKLLDIQRGIDLDNRSFAVKRSVDYYHKHIQDSSK